MRERTAPARQVPKEQAAPVPPQNQEAEESVVGAMLLSERAIDAALECGLASRDFYRQKTTGVIYDTIVGMYAQGVPVDAITLVDRLEEKGTLEDVGGKGRIHELAALVPAVGNTKHYATVVKDTATLRGLIAAGGEISRLGYDRPGTVRELVEKAEKTVFDLALTGRAGDFVPLSEIVAAAYARIEQAGSLSDVTGLPTGFRSIDELTSGFQPGNLIILAARPSMGKSGLALNVCSHVAVHLGLPVGLFTLEMSRSEVGDRMISSESMVDSRKIRNGRLSSEEWGRLTEASGRLHGAPMHTDDGGTLTAMEIRAKARRLKMRNPTLALIVVDYLQLMSSGVKTDSRVQDVSMVSRSLKVLAGELGVPVLALSQLSRQLEQRHDKRPILSDLRESGAIEQDADVIAFVYRDEYYHPEDTDQEGIAEVHIAKQRNGPTGTVKLAFVRRYTRFSELATNLP